MTIKPCKYIYNNIYIYIHLQKQTIIRLNLNKISGGYNLVRQSVVTLTLKTQVQLPLFTFI